jgi:primosomal protein N' (replication factor Y)
VPLVGGAVRRGTGDGEPERAPADHHVLVRVPAADTAALTRAMLALKAFRSARKEADVVSVRVDPLDTF